MRPFALILTVVLLRAAVPQTAHMQTRLQSSDLLKLRSVSAVEVSPDGTRVAYIVDNNDGPGRPYGQLWVMTLADGKSVRFGARQGAVGQSATGRPTASGSRIAAASATRAASSIAQPDGSGARFLAEMTGTNAPLPATGSTSRLVAGRQAHRVRLGGARPRNRGRHRRSDGHHALSLQAGRRRRHDALQRQPPAAHLRRRRRDRAQSSSSPTATHYEHSIDWSPNGDEIAVRLEPRAERRPVLQLRPVRAEARRQVDPPADRDRERRVPPALVARRQDDRVPGDQARPHRSRDDDGGHARLGDRTPTARNRREIGAASTTARARRSGRRTAARCCSRCRSAAASHLYRAAGAPAASPSSSSASAARSAAFSVAKNGASPTRSRRRPIRRELYVAGRQA